MTSKRLTCRQIVDLVTDYHEGALDADDRARFESHIKGCSWCKAYVDQMRRTIAMTGRLREEDIAPGMREGLLAVFRDWKGRAPASG